MAKKLLELTPTPLTNEEPEARYDGADRRLELTTGSGSAHKDFSHLTGTVVIDETGLEEFRKKEEAEVAARTAKTRDHHKREEEKLRLVMSDNTPLEQFYQKIGFLEKAGRFILISSVVYFGTKGVYELFCLAMGRAAPEMVSFFVLAALAGFIFSLPSIPGKLIRIFARLGYATFLIYFGVMGLVHLYGLYRHAPSPRYVWSGFAHHMVSVAFTVAILYGAYQSIRFVARLRQNLLQAFESPDAQIIKDYPILENREHLRMALYGLEGSIVVAVLLVCTVLTLRSDPVLLLYLIYAYPYLIFVYLYPFLAYVFFRKIFCPKI